jgi:hypothetical protein
MKTIDNRNSKNLGKTLVLGIFLLGIMSCEKDLMLEPENNITQTSFYTTELQIQQALSGVYSAMINSLPEEASMLIFIYWHQKSGPIILMQFHKTETGIIMQSTVFRILLQQRK